LEAVIVLPGESAFSQLFSAIWFILPAYVANASPLLLGGGPPLDGSRNFLDGRRVLGDGVTIRGTLGGVVVGAAIGALQGAMGGELGPGVLLGLAMGTGAMLGDSLGSFVKRRLGIGRGRPAPGLDQVGFVLVALAFAALVVRINMATVLILVILTPTIHLVTNAIAYQLGVKKVWY
jgi:CDP-2,3-bis-(O-geranylgeranyl)-sn-glycerol synthase